MRSIVNANIYNKKVLVRVDFNVSIVDGNIKDDSRIRFALPTINYLLNNDNKVILISHLGQPAASEEKFSLKNILPLLEKILGQNIFFSYPEQLEQVNSNITLLENLRFNRGEEQNSLEFAKILAQWGDVYVNEAFSCSHREHASIVTLPKLLPAFAGIGLMNEVETLYMLFSNNYKPSCAIIGGSKISTKLPLLKNLLNKVDKLFIGGAMANNLLKERNINIAYSLHEKDVISGLANHPAVILPQDVATAQSLKSTEVHICDVHVLPEEEMILDIGPASIIELKNILRSSKAVLWNGPVGAFEYTPFNKATEEIARYIANLTQANQLISIIGGGDTVAAVKHFKEEFTYVSTAGGAFLKWLEGNSLPGLKALEEV